MGLSERSLTSAAPIQRHRAPCGIASATSPRVDGCRRNGDTRAMFGKPRDEAGEIREVPPLDIVCPDETSARAEAARQQTMESEGAEWIYLRRDRDQQWVARRWVDDGVDRGSGSGGIDDTIGEVVVEALNPFNWFQP